MKEFLLIVVIVILMNTKKQISKDHYLNLGMLMGSNRILFKKGQVIKMGKNELLINICKIHTTYLGISRIKRNLGIEEDVVEFCKNKVLDKKSLIYRKGKNWYIENGTIKITINASSYTIITAHTRK